MDLLDAYEQADHVRLVMLGRATSGSLGLNAVGFTLAGCVPKTPDSPDLDLDLSKLSIGGLGRPLVAVPLHLRGTDAGYDDKGRRKIELMVLGGDPSSLGSTNLSPPYDDWVLDGIHGSIYVVLSLPDTGNPQWGTIEQDLLQCAGAYRKDIVELAIVVPQQGGPASERSWLKLSIHKPDPDHPDQPQRDSLDIVFQQFGGWALKPPVAAVPPPTLWVFANYDHGGCHLGPVEGGEAQFSLYNVSNRPAGTSLGISWQVTGAAIPSGTSSSSPGFRIIVPPAGREFIVTLTVTLGDSNLLWGTTRRSISREEADRRLRWCRIRDQLAPFIVRHRIFDPRRRDDPLEDPLRMPSTPAERMALLEVVRELREALETN